MSNAFDRTGFEDAILYSDEDYEPYGYAAPLLTSTTDVSDGSGFGAFEREVEAAVLRRLESYSGC